MLLRARWFSITASLTAAAAFALSVWVGRWWALGDVAVGPLGSRNCFDGNCRGGGLSWLGGTDLWMRSGVATATAGLLAMVLLLGIAGAFAARRAPTLLARMTLVTIACAIICGGYFVAKFPGFAGAGFGQGFYLFVAAIVAGVMPPLAVLRPRRPA